MADFLRQNAGELPAKAIYADPSRSVRRIDSLLEGGEVDLAAMVAHQTKPGAESEAKVLAAQSAIGGEQRQQEKITYLKDTLARLGALEASGNVAAAQGLAREALDRYPRVTAFQIAHAHFRKLPPPSSGGA
jgi:NaMN:DMB phosphoribosyltransferase